VTWEPSYSEISIEGLEKFLLLSATDGLWDVIEEDKIVEKVN